MTPLSSSWRSLDGYAGWATFENPYTRPVFGRLPHMASTPVLPVLQRLLTVACHIAIVVLYSLLGNQLTDSDLQQHFQITSVRRLAIGLPGGTKMALASQLVTTTSACIPPLHHVCDALHPTYCRLGKERPPSYVLPTYSSSAVRPAWKTVNCKQTVRTPETV